MSFLQMTVIGNVGKMPESRQVGEKSVVSFSVAHNYKVKGEKRTLWVSVSSWADARNQIILDYVRKGDQIMVQGTPSVRTFDSPTLGKQTSLELDITYGAMALMGSASSGSEDAGKPAASKPAAAEKMPADFDDEIPF